MFTEERTEEIAIHEAGHAVLHHFLGSGIDFVEVYDTEKKNGACGQTSPKSKRLSGFCLDQLKTVWPRMQDVMTRLAGIAAYQVLRGKQPSMKCGTDRRDAEDSTEEFCYSHDEAILCREWLQKRTEGFIQQPYVQKAIEALANALLAREPVKGIRRINGPEAESIIEHTLLPEDN